MNIKTILAQGLRDSSDLLTPPGRSKAGGVLDNR